MGVGGVGGVVVVVFVVVVVVVLLFVVLCWLARWLGWLSVWLFACQLVLVLASVAVTATGVRVRTQTGSRIQQQEEKEEEVKKKEEEQEGHRLYLDRCFFRVSMWGYFYAPTWLWTELLLLVTPQLAVTAMVTSGAPRVSLLVTHVVVDSWLQATSINIPHTSEKVRRQNDLPNLPETSYVQFK